VRHGYFLHNWQELVIELFDVCLATRVDEFVS